MNRILILSLTVGAAACGQGAATTVEEPRVPEPTLEVRREPLASTVPVDGTVAPLRRAEISTRMMARIAATPVEIGTRVRRGAVLIRLGTDDIAANREKASAAVAAAGQRPGPTRAAPPGAPTRPSAVAG